MKEGSEAPAAGSAKHTPGPWRWQPAREYSDWFELVAANGVVVHSDGSACAEYGPDIDVNGPDAKLIAAAPALADALEECRRQMIAEASEIGADDYHEAIRLAEGALHAAGRMASNASAPSGAPESVSDGGASLKGK